jgi:AcrR family transcriptional regulator
MTPATDAPTARIRIREAAVELMGRKGIAGTTTQDIARRADCSQAAIYKHWGGKEDLARETFEAAHLDMMAAMEAGAAGGKTPSQRVLGALLGFLGYARAHPPEYAFLFHVFHSDYSRWLAAHSLPRDVVIRELTRGMETGEVPEGDPQLRAAFLLGMAIRGAFYERQRSPGGDPREVEEALIQAAAAVLES